MNTSATSSSQSLMIQSVCTCTMKGTRAKLGSQLVILLLQNGRSPYSLLLRLLKLVIPSHHGHDRIPFDLRQTVHVDALHFRVYHRNVHRLCSTFNPIFILHSHLMRINPAAKPLYKACPMPVFQTIPFRGLQRTNYEIFVSTNEIKRERP